MSKRKPQKNNRNNKHANCLNVVGGFAVTNRMLNMIAGKRRGK